MKMLSVRQPHALNIVTGKKTIELRNWNTDYRGWILIASSKQCEPGYRHLPCGYTMGCAFLYDVVHYDITHDIKAMKLSNSQYKWSFLLKNAFPVSNLPIKGQLKLSNVDSSIIKLLNLSSEKYKF